MTTLPNRVGLGGSTVMTWGAEFPFLSFAERLSPGRETIYYKNAGRRLAINKNQMGK